MTAVSMLRSHPPRVGRLVAIVVMMIRALTLVAAFDISGLPHAVRDAVAVAADGELPADDRDDCGDSSCPMGCPSCHGGHGVSAAAPAAVAAISAPPAPLTGVIARPALVLFAPSPSRDSLFRPPRTLDASA